MVIGIAAVVALGGLTMARARAQSDSDLRLEFQPQFATIMSNSLVRIAAILTADQRERFQRFREENRRILQLPVLPPASPSGTSKP